MANLNQLFKTRNETGDFLLIDNEGILHNVHRQVLITNSEFYDILINSEEFKKPNQEMAHSEEYNNISIDALIKSIYQQELPKINSISNLINVIKCFYAWNIEKNLIKKYETVLLNIIFNNINTTKCIIRPNKYNDVFLIMNSDFPPLVECIKNSLKYAFINQLNHPELINCQLLLIILNKLDIKLYEYFEDFNKLIGNILHHQLNYHKSPNELYRHNTILWQQDINNMYFHINLSNERPKQIFTKHIMIAVLHYYKRVNEDFNKIKPIAVPKIIKKVYSVNDEKTVWVNSYVKSNGTHVSGHWRRPPTRS
jgi:hypothetical protein